MSARVSPFRSKVSSGMLSLRQTFTLPPSSFLIVSSLLRSLLWNPHWLLSPFSELSARIQCWPSRGSVTQSYGQDSGQDCVSGCSSTCVILAGNWATLDLIFLVCKMEVLNVTSLVVPSIHGSKFNAWPSSFHDGTQHGLTCPISTYLMGLPWGVNGLLHMKAHHKI